MQQRFDRVTDASITTSETCRHMSRKSRNATVVAFDAREHYKLMKQACQIELTNPLEDPKVASWLLDTDGTVQSLFSLATSFVPEIAPNVMAATDMASVMGQGGKQGTVDGAAANVQEEEEDEETIKYTERSAKVGLRSWNRPSLALWGKGPGWIRAALEVVVSFVAMERLRLSLAKQELLVAFHDVEMASQPSLASLELNGLAVNWKTLHNLQVLLAHQLANLESSAVRLAPRPFKLSSHSDIAHLLFVELGLAPMPRLSEKSSVRCPMIRGKVSGHLSTDKATLQKLTAVHPLPGLILEWRRVSHALNTTVLPLLRCHSSRFYPFGLIFTSTGLSNKSL
uniref:DNA polymerase theta-like n=1 Tax=Myxine glutinosa TaxID=7769 RepID=UPI00358F3A8E